MSRYELSLSAEYVPDWGLEESFRELWQNALDQEVSNPDNKMSWSWDVKSQIFEISSKESSLDKSTLLLGHSTKAYDTKTIGKFGEGYKLALLVLSRLGKSVKIFNYKDKELWTPKIIKSRRYGADLLVVDVKKYIFKSVPDANLTFQISGIRKDDYSRIKDTVLHMQSGFQKIETSEGSILTDTRHAGMIFVKGLLIMKAKPHISKYGYDLLPDSVNLDRDRALIESFDLNWQTSKIWGSGVLDSDMISTAIIDEIPDVKYLNSQCPSIDGSYVKVMDKFQATYGVDAIPVSDHNSMMDAKRRYPSLRPIVTSVSVTDSIVRSSAYSAMIIHAEVSPRLRSIRDIIRDIKDFLPDLLESPMGNVNMAAASIGELIHELEEAYEQENRS